MDGVGGTITPRFACPILGPRDPMLAHGGIVTRPMRALIGEARPEAVIPLGRSGVVGGPTVVVNFPPGSTVILDNEASARALASALIRLIRTELRSQRAF